MRQTENNRKEIAIHYIGWKCKYDEWLDCKHRERDTIAPRIHKRNTYTISPHRRGQRYSNVYHSRFEATNVMMVKVPGKM